MRARMNKQARATPRRAVEECAFNVPCDLLDEYNTYQELLAWSYEWGVTHEEWNRQQHALHGNGPARSQQTRQRGGQRHTSRGEEVIRFATVNIHGLQTQRRADADSDEEGAEEE